MFRVALLVVLVGTTLSAYQETKCANAGGTCQAESACSGRTLSGYCPTQPASIKCCVSSGGASGSVPSNSCGCGYDYASQCTGGPTEGAKRLASHFKQRFDAAKTEIYNCRTVRGGSTKSLHAEGRAVDVYLSGTKGRQAFEYAVSIACNTGIQEVIFNRRIWTSGRGEHAYNGVNPHTDHVHVGLNRCGATKWGV